jgi:uncharacterized ferritin-like protein (DUF455 family)
MSVPPVSSAATEGMARSASSPAAASVDLHGVDLPAIDRPRVDLHGAARACLETADPPQKLALAAALAADHARGVLRLGVAQERADEPALCIGRPARPRLVAPRALASRGLGSIAGRAAFVHAIAHIEFNAINLACDAVWRFRGMPETFYSDWIGVAADEARHFALLQQRLHELGHEYGDFDAHDGLWDMAERTAHSCLARMALVPRVLEARGLDVTPAMIERLRAVGDADTAAILELILREEVAHVAAGTRWFRWCCERDGLAPRATFIELLRAHAGNALRRPFNHEARRAAGFDSGEMAEIEAMTEGTERAA